MIIEVGEYYIDSRSNYIVQIIGFTDDILVHTQSVKNKKSNVTPTQYFIQYYKHLKGYNTPLHKAINS